jgi:hypothetical protein
MREARSESVPERRSLGRISGTAGVKELKGSAAKVKTRRLLKDSTGQAVHKAPPMKNSTKQSARAVITSAAPMRIKSADSRDLMDFMMFENRP